jgi:HAD superfamily phosphoserine phosphatase-like hydrolase
VRVFVDYDGTITDRDTFDLLVDVFAGRDAWTHLDRQLKAGALTLRQALAAQAALLRCTFEEADEAVAAMTSFDPTFAGFVQRCEREGATIAILSCGLGPLIERALERNGLAHVPLLANGAQAHSEGWRMEFVDSSHAGHDKAASVRAARDRGELVAYVGDGISDFEAALIADRRFARRGHSLEVHLSERGVPFVAFDSFADVERALFG